MLRPYPAFAEGVRNLSEIDELASAQWLWMRQRQKMAGFGTKNIAPLSAGDALRERQNAYFS
jgi:hypothetical protein